MFGHPSQKTWLTLVQMDRNLFDSHNKKPWMDREELEKQTNDAVKNAGPICLSLLASLKYCLLHILLLPFNLKVAVVALDSSCVFKAEDWYKAFS